MMLKINKTLPKNKARYSNNNNIAVSANRQHIKLYYLGLATLICGIMPGLMGLSYYNNSNEAYAAEVKILSDITTMQEMTPAICGNTEIGTSKVLIDTRDNSDYQVAKLSDGNCWMTQNLRIVDKTIASADSNVTSDFTIPNEAANFIGENNNAAYYPGDEDYGAYYSWYTATAGTGTAEMTSGNAPSSICPKSWQLPMKAEYDILTNREQSSYIKNNNKWGYWVDGTSSVEGIFFPSARYYSTDSLSGNSSYGLYHSSTARNETHVYTLSFSSSNSPEINSGQKQFGFPVRCLVNGNIAKDANISVLVSPTLTLDAVSGAEKIAADPNSIATGTIAATISSNTNYTVQLSSNKPNLTDPNHDDIEGIIASSNVTKGTNAWGILNSDNTTYSAITTTPATYYSTETTNPNLSKTHTFTLGVSISNTLPSGEYSTTVTITAVNN